MYLFTRQLVVNPAHMRAGLAHARQMLDYVNDKTDLEVSLFQLIQGAPLGTLSFVYRTDSYADSVAATDALITSDEYLDQVEAGAAYFVGNPEDRLASFLHMAGEFEGPPAAAAVVTARLEIDHTRKAIGWATELADYMAAATSTPVAVLASNTGEYGAITWITYGRSLKQLEESNAKTNADAGFLQRLEDSTGFFVSGSGRGMLSRRIG
jgi:hypothetical protein